MKDIIYIITGLLLFSCQSPVDQEIKHDRSETIRKIAVDYFSTFSQREDWEKLCSFYSEDMTFEDVTLQLKLDSLWQFKRFYKWDEEGNNFQKLSPEQEHLTIDHLLVNDSVAVATGRVNPFYYYKELIDVDWGMNMTIWLFFDDNLKIKKQIDWMEYDPSVLEGVVKHYNEKGIDKIPDWLDLSK